MPLVKLQVPRTKTLNYRMIFERNNSDPVWDIKGETHLNRYGGRKEGIATRFLLVSSDRNYAGRRAGVGRSRATRWFGNRYGYVSAASWCATGVLVAE